MRRTDREITDAAKIQAIIRRCTCCRLGFCDDGEVYIVPLSFGLEVRDGGYTFYFHGAREGRKLSLIEKSPKVGFELDTNYALNESEQPCGYSARFQSIIGTGTVSLVTEAGEKAHGLSLILEQATGRAEWDFTPPMLNSVAVFKLDVAQLSCKEHQ